MEIRADLMDAHLYAFKRNVLQEVLDKKDTFQSIKQDVLPYLVKSQLRSEISANGAPLSKDGLNENMVSQNSHAWLSQQRIGAPSCFHEAYASVPNGSTAEPGRIHKCCAYIASKDKYCARLNSIQAYCDINRDVIGEASHLSGYSFSTQNNIILPSAQLGSKTTIVNSIVMNHVTIEDGCLVQGSIICSNVHLQERVVLKDCQVGAGFVVTSGSEYKAESLSKKENLPLTKSLARANALVQRSFGPSCCGMFLEISHKNLS
ncbi:hypothetical protein QJS10_CPA05g00716 [Acorus calamus]|uniref:Uncharacterized protein n=1 Tax=Acorus calamus TaxID=4465 RepID=A0AAV9EWL5_ACOCL|nr:hypothetical protein QJS10_CPA05g00716 [Acorus calamus]